VPASVSKRRSWLTATAYLCQEAAKGKSRITIMLDNDVSMAFRARADAEGIGYQTLINQALRETLSVRPVNEATLRKILREELAAAH